MGKVVRAVVSIGATIAGAAIGFAIGGPIGASIGAALFSAGARALLGGGGAPRRAAAAAQLQLGEQPRQAIFGRAAVAGTLVDAFNYGGTHRTDWEVLVIALADHRCDALEGFFVDDSYHAFTGDGNVAGFNNQLQVFFRSGTWDQSVPSILTTNGPGWTANDRGRGVCYVVAAYKADASDAKNPVYPSGRPRFRWVLRGLRCYQPRKDSTVGGSGAHRRADPATWEWTENPIDIRHNWQRGIYAGDLVDQPGMLLIGRGLSAIEAPPANVFARANLCDEVVAGAPRYRIGGVVASTEPFIEVESDFAAAVAGVITQPEGAVEVDPGEAKAAVAHFTDADLIVGSKVRWSDFLGQQDDGWINTVVARFVDPGQRWNMRSAPVRRDPDDLIADGAPRETQPQLDLVTNAAQAQRIAEVIRRLGRLWGRGQVTLPPRFSFIEEGDWVTWQSARHFGGATRTLRAEAWGSGKDWHHQLTLRQISASVYSDTDPLDDGVIAADQPPPPELEAPGADAFSLAAVVLDGGNALLPALAITGQTDDPAARLVRIEFVKSAVAPDDDTVWTDAGTSGPEVTRREIVVTPSAQFYAAVSYVVDGVTSPRRVLGPVTTAGLGLISFDPVAPIDIQASIDGTVTTALPVVRDIILRVGGTAVTSGVTVDDLFLPGGIAATASVTDGLVSVSVSQADAAGVIIVPIEFGGQFYDREIVINWMKASGTIGGGAGSPSFSDDTITNISTTTYVQVTDPGVMVAASGSGELRFRFNGRYSGDGAAEVIARYSADGGATWIDAGASQVGSLATSGTGGTGRFDGPIRGYISLDRTVTGLTPAQDYMTALFARRTSGTGTLSWFQSTFSASQT